jgi:hypothetical protein
MAIVHKYIWNFVEKSKKLISTGDIEGAKKILGNNVNSDGGSGSLGKTVGANEQLEMTKEKLNNKEISFWQKKIYKITKTQPQTLSRSINHFLKFPKNYAINLCKLMRLQNSTSPILAW